MKLFKILATTYILLLSGCGGNAEPREYKQLGAGDKILYEEALANVGQNNSAALAKLDILELNYPKSAKLPEAMKLKIYLLYKTGDYDGAVIQADKFITMYPKHPNVDYAYYMKGLANQMSILDSQRDQQVAEATLLAFAELKNKFPNSEYVIASNSLANRSENILAVKEVEIGRFYASKGQNAAAADRYQCVLEKYPNTVVVPEAMYRMVEIHTNLNSLDYAQRYYGMLKQQYPSSPWTERATKIVIQQRIPITKQTTGYLNLP